MKTNIDYLSLVITKNCNLKCAHCLRGENEDSYMSDEVLENVFFKVGMVDCLVISGGEPFYSEKSIEVIDKIIKQIKKNNVTVNSFQIITNGTIYNENVVMILKKLCDITNNHDRNMLFISKDEFHESEINRLGLKEKVKNNEKSFETLANNLKIKFGYKNLDLLLDTGRAKNISASKVGYNLSDTMSLLKFKLALNAVLVLNVFDDGTCTIVDSSYEDLEKNKAFNICDQNNISLALRNYIDSSPYRNSRYFSIKRFFR